MLMRAETISATDVGMPRVVYQRDLMLLGSVLLPEPAPDPDTPDVVPEFYLDSPLRRALITRELRISIREFVRNADVASWRERIVNDGAHRGAARSRAGSSPPISTARRRWSPVGCRCRSRPWQRRTLRGQRFRRTDDTAGLRGCHRPDAVFGFGL